MARNTTAHVYVRPEDFDGFVSSLLATFCVQLQDTCSLCVRNGPDRLSGDRPGCNDPIGRDVIGRASTAIAVSGLLRPSASLRCSSQTATSRIHTAGRPPAMRCRTWPILSGRPAGGRPQSCNFREGTLPKSTLAILPGSNLTCATEGRHPLMDKWAAGSRAPIDLREAASPGTDVPCIA